MKKLIAANWKMNKTVEEAVLLAKELNSLLKIEKKSEVVLCPPFTALSEVSKVLKGSNIELGAQNMHFEDSGSYTGDISPVMLKGIGCKYVILGHSERREFFKEDDELINKKVLAALKHTLKPILCVGELLQQRENGQANNVVESQLKKCLENVGNSQMANVAIAYEPVWAISRGNPNAKAATKEDAEEMHKFVREVLSKMFGPKTAKNARILYGGSMKPENAKELLGMPNIDGGLIGNASLNAKSFFEIIKAA